MAAELPAGPVKVAADLLTRVLGTVPGLSVLTDPTQPPVPPAAVLGAPTLAWQGYNAAEPSTATFPVTVLDSLDEGTMERLWALLPRVAAVLDADPAALVVDATPTTWPSVTPEQSAYPAYRINVEVSLG